MTTLKRVMIQIKRKPFKTFCLFSLAFLLGTLISVSMLMDSAIDSVLENLSVRIAPVVSITSENPVLEEMYTNQQRSEGYVAHHFPDIERELIHEIGNLSYVRDFDYSILGGGSSVVLRPYIPYEIQTQLNIQFDEEALFDMIGVARPEIVYIEYGNFELVQGRLFTEEEILNTTNSSTFPILISDEFARHNGLAVDSRFNLYLSYFDPPADFPTELTMSQLGEVIWTQYEQDEIFSLWGFEHEVVGIFSFTEDIPTDFDGMMYYQQLVNTFFVPNWIFDYRFEAMLFVDENWISVLRPEYHAMFTGNVEWRLEPYWLLYDIRDMDLFAEAANEMLPGLWVVQDLSSTLGHVLTAVDNITFASTQFFWFSLGAALLVFSLLTLLYLRSKNHEVGVYLALGESKLKIMLQIALEIGLVISLGMLLSIFSGRMISNSITNTLLMNELTNQAVQNVGSDWVPANMLEVRGFTPQIDDLLDMTTVALDMNTAVLFYSITFAIVLLSTSIPMVYFFKSPVNKLLASAKIQ